MGARQSDAMTKKGEPASGLHNIRLGVAWFLWVAASLSGIAVLGFFVWIAPSKSELGFLAVAIASPMTSAIGQWIVLRHYLGVHSSNLWAWIPFNAVGYLVAIWIYFVFWAFFAMGSAEAGLPHRLGEWLITGAILSGVPGLILGAIQTLALLVCQLQAVLPMRNWFFVTVSGFVLGGIALGTVYHYALYPKLDQVGPLLQVAILLCPTAIFQGLVVGLESRHRP